jgi:hypothetical protein
MWTSTPLAWSTRTVASLSRANDTLAMQPARNATRARRSPGRRKHAADAAKEERRFDGGRERFGISQFARDQPVARTRRCKPER